MKTEAQIWQNWNTIRTNWRGVSGCGTAQGPAFPSAVGVEQYHRLSREFFHHVERFSWVWWLLLPTLVAWPTCAWL
jgi:hypothetical protein